MNDSSPGPSLQDIFARALELETQTARAGFLADACGGDARLRSEVESLLRAFGEAGDFLESPASTPMITADRHGPTEGPGATIGPYRLREVLGEGGMGVVYVAEQSQPVRRRVALKVIKPGMDTRQVIARFEAERQALAMMDHPNIARVYDAGTTSAGRPYFVMELVRGIPITAYCDRERLSIRQRLELFVLVCRAVQHAHQKGIIHRDLKPSNILVTVIDGAAVPKVIDFGVAKATGVTLSERTLYTAFHQMIGTPLYMSPEQADLSGMDVDTRSDIYSLGILLYELITGTTPFDRETVRRAAFDELRRMIREDVPPKPSTRLGSLGGTLTTVSANRGSEPRKLSHVVRGELDWVVMKALEKDRRRRYETANDFAADVMNVLTNRPVAAIPPSPWYRFAKAVRRNRVALTTTALVGLALVAGSAVSVWQAMKARKAAAEARLRADESRQVIDYLARDVFGAAAGRGGGRSMTVGQLLDETDATVGTRFRRQPLVEASVRLALSQTYHYLWELDRAERHAARAAEIRAQHLGPEHPQTLEALVQRAWVLSDISLGWAGHPPSPQAAEEAERILRPALTVRRPVLGPVHPETLRSELLLASTLSHLGRQDEAERLATRAERLAVGTLGPDHETSLWALDVLARIARRQGDLARAESLLRQSLAASDRVFGRLHLQGVETLKGLAQVVRERGRMDEARRLYLETINRYRSLYGLPHIRLSNPIGHLFAILESEHDDDAIHELCVRWLNELLATPVEADPYQRARRSIRLSILAIRLAMLPEITPADAALAIRAAEQAVELGDLRDNNWTRLGLIYLRTGDPARAAQAIQTSMDRRNGGDRFDWFVQAILHARRGEMVQARAWYDRALHDDTKPGHTVSSGIGYARAEAEALIDPKPTPERSK